MANGKDVTRTRIGVSEGAGDHQRKRYQRAIAFPLTGRKWGPGQMTRKRPRRLRPRQTFR
jgi:hypothetical protein